MTCDRCIKQRGEWQTSYVTCRPVGCIPIMHYEWMDLGWHCKTDAVCRKVKKVQNVQNVRRLV